MSRPQMTAAICNRVISIAIDAAANQVALARDLGENVDPGMCFGLQQHLCHELTGDMGGACGISDAMPVGALDLFSHTYSATVRSMAALLRVQCTG